MSKPIASLSLDLDNQWAYMRTHGFEGWQDYPSYLPLVAPRVVEQLSRAGLSSTVFVVGKDLECPQNVEAVRQLVDGGHEIANHSYWHYPWLDAIDHEELEREVVDAEEIIELHTGIRTRGFRAPGFSGSPQLLEILARRNYAYDASTFPTVIGPLAAWYARLKSHRKSPDGPRQRFATLADALGSLRPHAIETPCGHVVEVPVTTMPLARLPIHVTYLMYLRQYSRPLASFYLRRAIDLCRLRGVGPSMLLHPLDFLGGDEVPQLAFFPGMNLPRGVKESLLDELFDLMQRHFEVGTLLEHAAMAQQTEPMVEYATFSTSTVQPTCEQS
jgi:hypothetical protein